MVYNFVNEATTIIDTQGNAAISLQRPDLIIITGQTIGSVTENIYDFDLGTTPGAYNFFLLIVGYSLTTGASTVERSMNNITTDGIAGTFVEKSDRYAGNIPNSGVQMTVSGNNGRVQLFGSAGHTINWRVELKYLFVS